MIAADPDNPKWRLELVYSSSNLGIVQNEQARYADAARTFQASVAAMDVLISAEPGKLEYQRLMSEALAYYSDALSYNGQMDLAIQERKRQLALLAPYLAQAKPDAEFRQDAMIANMVLSRLQFERGETRSAQEHAAAAVELGHRLIELEPANADWRGRSANTLLNQALLLLRSGKIAEARAAADEGCAITGQLVARDATVASWRESDRRCLGLRAELAVTAGSKDEALFLARQLLEAVRSDKVRSARDRFALAEAHKLVGDVLWRSGDRAGAIEAWRNGLAAWPKGIAERPRQLAERGEMLRGMGQRAEGLRIASQLKAMGYRQSLSNTAGV